MRMGLLLVLLLAFGLSVGCEGRRAKRYERLRRNHPESYRVALLPVESANGELSKAILVRLRQAVQEDLQQAPEFIAIDEETVLDLVREELKQNSFLDLQEQTRERIGELLDIEGFLLPRMDYSPKDQRISLQLDLYNGYSGRKLWSRSKDSKLHRRHRSLSTLLKLARDLIADLRKDFEKLLEEKKRSRPRTIPQPHPSDKPRTSQQPGPRDKPSPSDKPRTVPSPISVNNRALGPRIYNSIDLELSFGERSKDSPNHHRPVTPSYQAGAEQLQYDLGSFLRKTKVPKHPIIKSLLLNYLPKSESSKFDGYLQLKVLDLNSPKEARQFLDDYFIDARPQTLQGLRCFALRDLSNGRLCVGVLLGKFAAMVSAAQGGERILTEFMKAFIEHNSAVSKFYLDNPSPPKEEAMVKVIKHPPQKERVVREVHHETKIERVEIPKTIVPEIEIRLDGENLLDLILDRKASREGRIVLSTRNRATSSIHSPSEKIEPSSKEKQSQSSSENIESVKGTDTNSPEALLHYNLACRYLGTSRIDKAIEEFLKALDHDRAYPAARSQLEDIKENFGKEFKMPSLQAPKDPRETDPNSAASLDPDRSQKSSESKTDGKSGSRSGRSSGSKAGNTKAGNGRDGRDGSDGSDGSNGSDGSDGRSNSSGTRDIKSDSTKSSTNSDDISDRSGSRNRENGNYILLIGVIIAIVMIFLKTFFLSE